MAKVKPKKSREDKLAEARLRRKKKYEDIKNDPEKYAMQKKKERMRYLKRKEQKKIKSVADMTSREKRHQRKKWRENSKRRNDKKKTNRRIQQLIVDNTPPESEREDNADVAPQLDPLEGPSHQAQQQYNRNCKTCQKKDNLIKKLRYNHKKQIGKLKQEKEKIEKERDSIKRMLAKMIKKSRMQQTQTGLSTEQKVNKLIETVDSNKREEVKKKILFGEIVSRNLSAGFKGLRKKEKRVFSDIIMKDKDIFKKHKILGHANKFTVRDKILSKNQDFIYVRPNIQQQIEDFFDDDSNTNISPEKNEFITRNGLRKQKRYLSDTLSNLYKKFINMQNSDVGYSTFCKHRPFWALYPKESDRNTCACKVHVNFDLLVKSLNKNRIIKEANGAALLQSLCCDIYNEICLNRVCEACKRRGISFLEFDNENKINYYEWGLKKEKYFTNGNEKTKIINTKRKTQDYPKNVIEKLLKSLNSYIKHNANIVAQHKHLKTLKVTLTALEAVVHLDFSENYSVQFNEEIQSFHFGGSRTQITLHTAVIYMIDEGTGIMKPYSVCSVSECNQHDARAIWAHLIPLLAYIQELSSRIDTIHFISNSPSSQYRNRYMFYVISQLQQDFPEIKSVTWNYLEAGHGKGAPDGVGAVLKRTADQVVRMGKDIGTIKEFWKQINRKVKNIKLLSVSEQDVKDKSFPSKVQPFHGSMSVHQVLWSYNSSRMTFRKLSCFFCENDIICSHGYHLGFLDTPPIPDNESLQFEDFLEKNTTGSFFKEVANAFSPTLEPEPESELNLTQHSHLASIMDIDMPPNTKASTSGITQNKTITVLSDIRLHWSNKSFTKKNRTECYPRIPSSERFVAKKEQEEDLNKENRQGQLRTVKNRISNFFDDSSDEDLRYGEYETKNTGNKVQYEDTRKDIRQIKEDVKIIYPCDSSEDDIF